jgi:hypothetical protein
MFGPGRVSVPVKKGMLMTDENEAQKVCLEFADFPGADMPWLVEKAKGIEDAMTERLPGAFLWHSVVAHPEIDGFRVFFQVDPQGGGPDDSMPETLMEIIREIAGDPPGEQALAA